MQNTAGDPLKDRVCRAVDDLRPKLLTLSHDIHDNPELQFVEHKAAAWLTGALEDGGFSVERGVLEMETAFVGTLQSGSSPSPTVAFIAEYDALRGIGHACGHNILGSSNIGAGLAMASVLPELGGRVKVFGTPAEEGGGGKIPFVENGYFDDVTAAISMHPAGGDRPHAVNGRCLAVHPLTFTYHGKPAHAAAGPEQGINALDAMIQTFNGINALRQHLLSDVRIHGIIRHGGEAVNVVPEYAQAEFLVRAADWDYLEETVAKVKACAQAGAMAAGARLEIEDGLAYRDMRPHQRLSHAMLDNIRLLGMEPGPLPTEVGSHSTDLGTVSHALPTVAASVCIAGPGIFPHMHEFADAAGSARGDEAVIIAAKVMAMTAIDVLRDPAIANR